MNPFVWGDRSATHWGIYGLKLGFPWKCFLGQNLFKTPQSSIERIYIEISSSKIGMNFQLRVYSVL